MKKINRTIVFLLIVFGIQACNSSKPTNLSSSCTATRTTPDAPLGFRQATNPLLNNTANLDSGEMLYKKTSASVACIQCHGKKGDGNGAMAYMFNPSPRNFTCDRTMSILSDGQLYYIIKHGSSNTSMPAHRKLNNEQIWQLVSYIRNFSDVTSETIVASN